MKRLLVLLAIVAAVAVAPSVAGAKAHGPIGDSLPGGGGGGSGNVCYTSINTVSNFNIAVSGYSQQDCYANYPVYITQTVCMEARAAGTSSWVTGGSCQSGSGWNSQRTADTVGCGPASILWYWRVESLSSFGTPYGTVTGVYYGPERGPAYCSPY